MRLLILLLAATLTFAQDKPTETKQEPQEAEVITVKTLTGDSFDRLLKMLEVFPAKYHGDSQLKTIVVYGTKDVVAQMRRVIEQLDKPGSEAAMGRNIDMTLTLLRCSTKAGPPGVLPWEMESVARQLRAATQCKDVQVWDVIPMRLQEGKDSGESLRLPGLDADGHASTFQVTIHPEAVYRKEQARYVRFARVDMNFQIPSPERQGRLPATYNLRTSGDFMEGQKTVLGKVSGVAEDEAIFAVITLKVLD